MAYNRYIQGIREPSFLDYPAQKEDRRMKFLKDPDTEFHRGDDGIWIASNAYKKISMQISEQLFRQINDNPPPSRPIYSLRSGNIQDDYKVLFDNEQRDQKRKIESIQKYGIAKENIVRIKNEELATQCKKENTHFVEEVEFLNSICNLMLIHDLIKVKHVLLCKSVIERLAPGDAEEVAFFASNFKVFELDKYAPKKFEYKNVTFYMDEDVSNDEVFRFEFDEQ